MGIGHFDMVRESLQYTIKNTIPLIKLYWGTPILDLLEKIFLHIINTVADGMELRSIFPFIWGVGKNIGDHY